MTSPNEQQRVDVLRTLDAEIMSITMLSGHYAAAALIEARAAMAELVAASRHAVNVDRVTDGLRDALARIGGAA